MTTMIPSQDIKLGQVIDYNGLQLKADELYTQGKDAKVSGKEYFMRTKKGVIGFTDVSNS